jgi:hypothetical protein
VSGANITAVLHAMASREVAEFDADIQRLSLGASRPRSHLREQCVCFRRQRVAAHARGGVAWPRLWACPLPLGDARGRAVACCVAAAVAALPARSSVLCTICCMCPRAEAVLLAVRCGAAWMWCACGTARRLHMACARRALVGVAALQRTDASGDGYGEESQAMKEEEVLCIFNYYCNFGRTSVMTVRFTRRLSASPACCERVRAGVVLK